MSCWKKPTRDHSGQFKSSSYFLMMLSIDCFQNHRHKAPLAVLRAILGSWLQILLFHGWSDNGSSFPSFESSDTSVGSVWPRMPIDASVFCIIGKSSQEPHLWSSSFSILLNYLEVNDPYDWKGILMASGMLACNLVMMLTNHHSIYHTWQIGIRVKSICNSIVYRKVLRQATTFIRAGHDT